MKKIVLIFTAIVLSASLTCCGSMQGTQNNDADLAGYTLKSQRELMQQKIVSPQSKTVIVRP
jgi:uncharacterized lipoprotein YehR (DUF1307 family)